MRTFVGDLTIDAAGNLAMLQGEQAASEVCRNFALTQKGEMIFKAQEGMPFIGGVFDDNDLAQFEAAFKRRIKQVPLADAQVIAFDAEVVGNVLSYEAVIQTKFGQMVQMADYEFIEPTGVIVPDTSDTLAEVEQEWRDIFGADLVTSPETPQGAIITALAIGRDNTARNNAEVANQINPALASGIWLDVLCSLTGVQRNAATRSTIAGVKCTGVNGTVIPANSKVKSSNGDVFLTAQATVIANNEAYVDVIAQEVGTIAVAPHALQTIAESVLGWETVDNDNAAVVGRLTESDEQLRAKRRDRIARQSVGHNAAIIAALYDIPEVQSLSFRENYESTTETIDGVTLKANSIYVCINGGLDVDIAKTLKRTKSLGCGYNGTESVTIQDEITRQDYVVLFDRPSVIDVRVRVTIESTNVLAEEIIKTAIMQMSRGEIKGDSELVIGRSVSAFEIAAAINFAEPSIFVKNVELSPDGSNWSGEIDISIQEIAAIQESAIQVIES